MVDPISVPHGAALRPRYWDEKSGISWMESLICRTHTSAKLFLATRLIVGFHLATNCTNRSNPSNVSRETFFKISSDSKTHIAFLKLNDFTAKRTAVSAAGVMPSIFFAFPSDSGCASESLVRISEDNPTTAW